MQHPEEGTIHAWLDGALDAEESARVERHVAECAMCASAVAEARGLVAGASRILAALDDVPSAVPRSGGSLGGSASGQHRPRSLWTFLHMTPTRAAAAAILIVAAGTVLVWQDRPTARQITFQASAPVVSRPQVSVPATPLPQSTVADSTAVLHASVRVREEQAVDRAAGNAGRGQANSSAPVVAQAPKPILSRNADVSEKRSLEQVQVTATIDSAKAVPAPAARPLANLPQRKELQNAQATAAAESRSAVVGGAAPAPSAMSTSGPARLFGLPNYAGCYTVDSRGDSLSSLPKLLSLDSARFDKTAGYYRVSVTQLFSVSAVTDAGRRAIDTASWQPQLDGVRIAFGRTPIELRRSSDSTLSAAVVGGRGPSVTMKRVNCPPR